MFFFRHNMVVVYTRQVWISVMCFLALPTVFHALYTYDVSFQAIQIFGSALTFYLPKMVHLIGHFMSQLHGKINHHRKRQSLIYCRCLIDFQIRLAATNSM